MSHEKIIQFKQAGRKTSTIVLRALREAFEESKTYALTTGVRKGAEVRRSVSNTQGNGRQTSYYFTSPNVPDRLLATFNHDTGRLVIFYLTTFVPWSQQTLTERTQVVFRDRLLASLNKTPGLLNPIPSLADVLPS